MEAAKAKKMEQVFARVLSGIAPSDEEAAKTSSHARMLVDRLKKIVPSDVRIVITGSIAKGTDLKGAKDIDIFMLFQKKRKKEEIVKAGLEYGKKLVEGRKGERYEIRYAEHPYVRVYLDALGVRADIVPALNIDKIDEMGTAVDRSPLHTEFVNKNLTKKQKDDVRLLKHFLKVHNLYGAELRIKGFSGYLCELLIHQYGSMAKLLERASNFRLPIYMEPLTRKESHEKGLVEKFNSQFVVVDPVDPKRNVAAIVTRKSLGRFVVLSRLFVDDPTEKLFRADGSATGKTKGLVRTLAEKAGLHPFLIVTDVADKSEDTVWPQLKKISELIIELLNRSGFEIFISVSSVQGKKGLILLLAPDREMRSRLLKGPDALVSRGTSEFVKKHRKAIGFVYRDSTVYALEPSRYRNIGQALKDVLSRRLVKGRKDVKMSGAKLITERLPKEYEDSLNKEIAKRLSL